MTETAVQNAKNAGKVKKSSEFARIMKQLSYNKLAVFGLFLFIVFLIACFVVPPFLSHGYNDLDVFNMAQGPSAEHWFGTDEMGRDILVRIFYGGRYSLTIGIFATLLSTVLGIVFGSIAGFFGGQVDNLMMRFLDVIQSLPGMLLTIVLSAVLGPGYVNTILALGINGIAGPARMLRASMLKVRQSEYIEAAESINCSKATIIISHLLPNSISPLIIQTTMGIASGITMASSLSFVGLGVQAPTPEWGAMLSSSRLFILTSPHMVIFPGLAIAITVLSLNLFGDGLRDALDPKMKR